MPLHLSPHPHSTTRRFHITAPFTVDAAGTYAFRFHTDFGRGGFMGVDDGLRFTPGDFWGHYQLAAAAMTQGDHVFEALGFEGCCDGHSEIEIHLPGDAETDPWRPITTGASTDLVGDCDAPAGDNVVIVATDGITGMTTYQLTYSLDASQANVYAMAGTADTTMAFPPAFQVATPFGADIGGVARAFFALNADSEFDSWLTVGVTDGTAGTALSAR